MSVTTRSAVSFPDVDLVVGDRGDDGDDGDDGALSVLREKDGDAIREAVPFPMVFVSFTAPTK